MRSSEKLNFKDAKFNQLRLVVANNKGELNRYFSGSEISSVGDLLSMLSYDGDNRKYNGEDTYSSVWRSYVNKTGYNDTNGHVDNKKATDVMTRRINKGYVYIKFMGNNEENMDCMVGFAQCRIVKNQFNIVSFIVHEDLRGKGHGSEFLGMIYNYVHGQKPKLESYKDIDSFFIEISGKSVRSGNIKGYYKLLKNIGYLDKDIDSKKLDPEYPHVIDEQGFYVEGSDPNNDGRRNIAFKLKEQKLDIQYKKNDSKLSEVSLGNTPAPKNKDTSLLKTDVNYSWVSMQLAVSTSKETLVVSNESSNSEKVPVGIRR